MRSPDLGSGRGVGLPSRARLLRWFAAVSFAGLTLSVVGVAAVAISAESAKNWGGYFLMERAMAVGTPVTLAFFGLSMVAGFGLVIAAGDGADA